MAASNVNVVVITGNLTRDPELRHHRRRDGGLRAARGGQQPPQGRSDAANGSTSPTTSTSTVWGAQGENCANYLSKGRPVAVEGRLDWREWEAKDGSGKRQSGRDHRQLGPVPRLARRLGRRWRRRQRRRLQPRAATSRPTPRTSRARRPVAAAGTTTSPSRVADARARRSSAAARRRSVRSDAAYGHEQVSTSSGRDRRGAAGAAPDRARPRKYTRINSEAVDYKDLNLLRRFLSDKGKTRGRRVTGLSRKHQRQLSVAVKRAREIALLPYVGER